MSPEAPTLDAKALADLVAGAAANAAANTAGGAKDFDWRSPCRFTRQERDRLDAFAKQAATRIGAELTSLLRRPIAFTPGPVTQHYGDALWNPAQTPLYGVPVTGPDGQTCGLVGLAPELAIDWVERLLGGGAADKPAADKPAALRPLSSLEQALLVDIVAVLIRAFSAASKEAGGPAVQHVESVATDQSPLGDAARNEFCRLVLTAEAGAGAAAAADAAAAPPPVSGAVALCLRSDLLAPVADPNSLKKPAPKAEDIRKELLGHLAGAPVTATARLGAAVAAMRDIASLEPGDILILQRAVNEPLELVVMGNVVQVGLPVISGGFYGLQIQDQRQWPRIVTHEKENRS